MGKVGKEIYEPVCMNMILRYVKEKCITSEGDTISINSRQVYKRFREVFEKFNISYKQFLYVWSVFRRELRDSGLIIYERKGMMAVKKDICKIFEILETITRLVNFLEESRPKLQSITHAINALNAEYRRNICMLYCSDIFLETIQNIIELGRRTGEID